MANFLLILLKNLSILMAIFIAVVVATLVVVWIYEVFGKGFEPVVGLFLFALPFGMIRVLLLYAVFISWNIFQGKNKIYDYCISAFLAYGILASYVMMAGRDEVSVYIPFGLASACVILAHFFIAKKVFKSVALRSKKEVFNA